MAVVPADLIYPTGELRSDWFPDGEDLEASISAWLNLMSGETDAKQTSYAYYRAYWDIAARLAEKPNPYREGQVLEGFQDYGFFVARARKHLADYQGTLVRSRLVTLETRF